MSAKPQRAGVLDGVQWLPPQEVTLPCATDPDHWYSPKIVDQESARAGCMRCPIRLECLEAALRYEGQLDSGGRYGVWGATTPQQREAIARNVEAFARTGAA